MSTLSDTMAALMIACADAPTADERAGADDLLYAELYWRFTSARDEFHLVTRDGQDLFALQRGPGGVARANLFYFAQNGLNPGNRAAFAPGSARRDAPPSASSSASYRSALDAITTDGAALVAAVQGSMGGAFNATRRELNGGASAGAAFTLGPVLQMLADGVAGAALTFGSGSWRVQLSVDVTSRGAANPTTVALSIAVDGSVVSTHSLSRASGDVDDAVHFETDDTITLVGSQAITIVNAGSFEEDAHGILRVFPA